MIRGAFFFLMVRRPPRSTLALHDALPIYKDASAIEAGQVAGKVILAFFGGNVVIDTEQKFKVSVVTRKQVEKDTGKEFVIVRVTFQRIVWNENGQISKLESLEDPKLYEKFFGELSRSLFLTAHYI